MHALEPQVLAEDRNEPQLTREVDLDYRSGTRSFDVREDVKSAYEDVAHQFGVDVAFDVDLPARSVRFRVSDVDFPCAMRLLAEMTGTFWRPLTAHLFFVTEDTPQKRKRYDVSIAQTFPLPASETPEETNEIVRTVREITGITRSDLDTTSRTLTLRASPRAIVLAADLIKTLEQPHGEMILEMEILEIDRNSASQFGNTPPQTSKIFSLSPQEIREAEQSYQGLFDAIEQVFGISMIPPVVAFGGGASTFLTELPNAAVDLSRMLSVVRQGRRVLLRAQDGEPATFFVGDRIPVSFSAYSASLSPGSSSNNPDVPAISNYATGSAPAFVVAAALRNNGIT